MQKERKARIPQALFKFVRFLVRVFYGKAEVCEKENIPLKNTVIVANHTQIHGPIISELFMPENCYIWCAGQMMNICEVPEYAFKDFWSQKPKWTHPLFKAISYIIAPLASFIFNNARTIAVYRDNRIIHTFKQTVRMLTEGKNIIIFPEKDEKYNNIIYSLEENFIDIAKLFYKKSGVELDFLPMYIAPSMRKTYFGQKISFNSENDIADERKRISKHISNEITRVARELPKHTVVPYRNIPKKYYLSNKDISEVPNEKACS